MRKVRKSKIQHELDKAVGNKSKHFSIDKSKSGWKLKHLPSGRYSMIYSSISLGTAISWATKFAIAAFILSFIF